MFDNQKNLMAVYYPDGKKVSGYLDDYAFFAESCLTLASKIDWLSPPLSSEYISRAQIIVDLILKHFQDPIDAGFFFTPDYHQALLARKKYWWDQATPSGNASLIHCFSALYALTGDSQYAEQLQKLRNSYSIFAKNAPNGVAYALSGFIENDIGITILKMGPDSIHELNTIQEFLSKIPYTKTFLLMDKKLKPNQYQLCIGTQCFELTESLGRILERLKTMRE